MSGRVIMILTLLWCSGAGLWCSGEGLWRGGAMAAEIVDSTGRTVQAPDHVARVVPAGPPAAVLLDALAPDLMVGWPSSMGKGARALVSPEAAKLPQIPRVTGREDVSDAIKALKPDLIVDYGTVSPRYADLARTTQQRTGVATILLDGAMTSIPGTLRKLGAVLHREERADMLAKFAEALLALPASSAHPRVLYARGPDGSVVAAANTDVTEVFTHLGWQVVAPDGQGPFRTASVDTIRTLDPDMLIFADPAMGENLQSEAWKSVRAVREGHAVISPSLPFGWVEEPPSINRLIGLAWLEGRDPVTLTALSSAIVYDHVLTPAERDSVLAGVSAIHP